MFKALTAIVALAASASVMAQGDVTLNSLAHDAATRASFNQMVKGHQLPALGDHRRHRFARADGETG